MDYMQGNKGLDAKTPNLPEGKVSVEQIMSLCQALGYFPSGTLYFSAVHISSLVMLRKESRVLTPLLNGTY